MVLDSDFPLRITIVWHFCRLPGIISRCPGSTRDALYQTLRESLGKITLVYICLFFILKYEKSPQSSLTVASDLCSILADLVGM